MVTSASSKSALYLVEDDGWEDNVEEHVGVEVELLPHAVVHHQPHRQPCTTTTNKKARNVKKKEVSEAKPKPNN